MPTTGQHADQRREQIAYRLRTEHELIHGERVNELRPIRPASTDDFPTPNPFEWSDFTDEHRNLIRDTPLFATVNAREQLVAWLLLPKNSWWLEGNRLADEAALEAALPPALFDDWTDGTPATFETDTDDGSQVITSEATLGTEEAAFAAAHPDAEPEDFIVSRLREGALEWSEGDPQP